MATAPSSTGGKPPDHLQNMRPVIALPTQKTPSQTNIPARTDPQNSGAITVHQNRLLASKTSKGDSGSNFDTPLRGDYFPSHYAPPHQNPGHSTVKIIPDDLLQIAGQLHLAGDRVTAIQTEKERYKKLRLSEENTSQSPISHGYQPQSSILQSITSGSLAGPSVRRNASTTSGPIEEQFPIGNPSTTPMELLCKESSQFIPGIDHHHQRKNFDLQLLAGQYAPGIIGTQIQCQTLSAPQMILPRPTTPILQAPTSSDFKKGVQEHCSFNGVRPNVSPVSEPIGTIPIIEYPALTPKDTSCEVSKQFTMENDHQLYRSSSKIDQLARHGAQGIFVIPHQCQPILQGPSLSNAKSSMSNHGDATVQSLSNQLMVPPEIPSTIPTSNPIAPASTKDKAPASDPTASAQPNQSNQAPLNNQNNNKSIHPPPLKVSSNFERPPHPKKNKKNPTKPPDKPDQSNPNATINQSTSNNQNKAKQPANPPPSPPTVIQSFATRLRARHEAERNPLVFSPPVITTKQGKPAVIFKRDDYTVKFADRCKFTVVGKFTNTMPRMEIIRKSFITQTELRGGVKIAHFNAKTVYIDLDNEYDHSTVWSKKYMYIQGQMMRIEAWNPIFKPNEDSPIVPVWIMIPKLPWHLYYMEILSPLLSPVGKALFLDLASFQKTRGSVAKVKMQVHLTKDRPTHVWLGYDEDQDVNGDGQWLEKKKEEDSNEAKIPQTTNLQKTTDATESSKQNQGNKQQERPKNAQDQSDKSRIEQHQKQVEHQNIVTEITEEEWQIQKKKNFKGNNQNKKQQQIYVPKQAIAQQSQAAPTEAYHQEQQSLGILSINPPAPLERSVDSGAQNQPNPPVLPVISDSVDVVEGGKVECQENHRTRPDGDPIGVGFPHAQHECANAHLDDHRLDLRAPVTSTVHGIIKDQQLPKGEGYEVSSSEEELMDQHSAEVRLSKVTILKRPPDPYSTAKSQAYQDPSSDPSLSQPLINTNAHSTDTENDTTGPAHKNISGVLAAIPMEDCPLPQLEEYRSIQSEDEMSDGLEEENEINKESDDDQHYDMLVNGKYQQSETIVAQGLSPRSFNPSPRLTRRFYGPRYTWSNGRGPCSIVWKRLDTGMVNDNWIASYPATTISHLASTGSDHSPLLMEMHVRPDNAIRYFKILNCWTDNDSFLPLVQEIWKMQVRGNPMWIFHQKIKALCTTLSKWSRQEYGDIFHKAKEFEEKVRKEAVLKQKTQLQWFKDGYANSKYFHSLIRGRRRKLYIHKIKDKDGDWIHGDEAIGEAACAYFQNLFSD
ncbi:hypothetical protein A4A49_25953 [Nicotiana attenuata]|uniref:DUF4283 domain-containing protein n=1 Tax=Nicotiana attenuata TaxID=49451 RepID=A0A314KLU3_NICAT|nr:hypothetical protein A4A49_25953 [Nicotiana attenuata]